jgi:hypothetical protein
MADDIGTTTPVPSQQERSFLLRPRGLSANLRGRQLEMT